jgi:hypothetical protein
MSHQPTRSRAWLLTIGALGTWAAINGIIYATDFGKRYRAEAAWFLFAITLIAAAIHATGTTTAAPERRASIRPRIMIVAWLASLAIAAALYVRVISNGLLSDDFALLDRAQRGILFDNDWVFLRPLPLMVWRGFSYIGNDAFVASALHAFNIALHGTNAWLVGLLAMRFGLPAKDSVIAALLFLVFPAAIEPVAWISGVFDVLLVTLALAACIALTAPVGKTLGAVIVAILTAAALATKETAVVLPGLLMIAAYGSPLTTLRRAVTPIAISSGVVALYLFVRLITGFTTSPPMDELSGYAVKEILSRPFGLLALPFHADFMASNAWIPFVFAVAWPVVLVASSANWWDGRRDGGLLLALSAWILGSVAPAATTLFVADDLEGSRYLYLGSVAWSIMIVVLVGSFHTGAQAIAFVPLIALSLIATQAHQSPWLEAARERDRVLDAFRRSQLSCRPKVVLGLPDAIGGAYVFRNGFAEATADPASSPATQTACDLVWDGRQFSLGVPKTDGTK